MYICVGACGLEMRAYTSRYLWHDSRVWHVCLLPVVWGQACMSLQCAVPVVCADRSIRICVPSCVCVCVDWVAFARKTSEN